MFSTECLLVSAEISFVQSVSGTKTEVEDSGSYNSR
jgi:hypothetical protein